MSTEMLILYLFFGCSFVLPPLTLSFSAAAGLNDFGGYRSPQAMRIWSWLNGRQEM